MIKYSFIIPVYNRPDELHELLSTFPIERTDEYEVIIVEDGSEVSCEPITKEFEDLQLTYHFQTNTGPGPARNTGASLAKGEWLVFLDSDTLISEGYFDALALLQELTKVVFFGGPDRNHASFTPIQLAIGYSMTSFLSTGGIRGSKRSLEKFKPRSFNMGIKSEVFNAIGGFSQLRFGEDVDLSLRMEEKDYKGTLLEGAIVYHKRRTSFRQFFKQVFNSGMARMVLSQLHPGSMKIVHLLPVFFVLYHAFFAIPAMLIPALGFVLLVYPTLYFVVGLVETKSFPVATLATVAVYIQLFGYGLGFLMAAWTRFILRRDISYAFRDTFYQG